MDELRALNARFIHNFVTNDVASHDAILHPGFINIWPTGQRWDRATYLKYWATAFDPKVIVYWDVRDELITVIGNVALVRSTNKSIAPPRWKRSNRHDHLHRYLSVRERRVEMHSGPDPRRSRPSIIPPMTRSSASISKGRLQPRAA